MPAAIIRKDVSNHFPLSVTHPIASKTTAVAKSPKGNTTRIGCAACPKIFILLSIFPPGNRIYRIYRTYSAFLYWQLTSHFAFYGAGFAGFDDMASINPD